MADDSLELKIGKFLRDRREKKHMDKNIINIVRNAGYKNSIYVSLFDDDVNVLGKPKRFSETCYIGKPFTDVSVGRYAIVPVHHEDQYSGHESERLVLVDLAKKTVMTIAHSGDRGVHYNGKCKFVPLAMNITDDKKAIISYKYVLHADLKNPIMVDDSIWEKYFFRKSEHCVVQADLAMMSEKKDGYA